MGYVKVKAKVSNPFNRRKSAVIELLADTEAIYTAIPEDILDKLDVKPVGKRKFKIASGEVKELTVGEVFMEIGVLKRLH